ncbi:RNA 2',3'-cyclic phosphodiesterase [Oligoflexus tunisiensis]|uniref:RNA 2',3'-cyclic phosphodiesterase n=1 Tax=Oligoflexus tunisiensis TaxID=708132 RepID=UPI00159F15F9|nr:RNA 2',3'-cyclic phosphodiesterase [Oligoflexus tunisiensis]
MAFFAIPIPVDLKAQLAADLAPLRKEWPSVQWVHPEDFHLTLRFIGGLQHEAMTRLLAAVQDWSLPFTPFSLELQGVRTFPPHRDRGVLWIDLETMWPELIDLQQSLEEQVQGLGFEPERRAFTPHLTIARFKRGDADALMEALTPLTERAWGRFTCEEYVLMKRRSGARDHAPGPLYEVLTRFTV